MKKICLLLSCLLLLGLLAGCSFSDADYKNSASTSYDVSGAYREEPMAEAAPMEMEEAAEEEATSESAASLFSASGKAGSATQNLKLIYTAEYSIRTRHYEKDLADILEEVHAAGGYVSEESTSGTKPEAYGDTGRHTSLTLRIPAQAYTGFTARLDSIGELVSRDQWVEDVTASYFDTQARIDMLEQRLSRLQAHLQSATDMEDIIALETEISQILYELDNYKGEKRYLDDQIQMSTLYVRLTEVVQPKNVAALSENTGDRAADSFQGSLQGIGVFFQDLWVFLAGAVPVLLILVLITGIVLAIVIPLHKRRKKRKKQVKPEE